MAPLDVSALFQPLRIGMLDVATRIVMPAMTRSRSPGGVPTEEMAAYYARRAARSVGLIISEGTGIDRPSSTNDPKVPLFHGAERVAGWKRSVDMVHAAGGRMAPQLWHVGSVPHIRGEWTSPVPVESPSGLVASSEPGGRAMSEGDIADTIEAYGRSARTAAALGFDAIEVHAAHGYLIDQFFWSATNLRKDRYGGSTLSARTRFAVEIVRRMRREMPRNMPLILRISQFKQQDYGVKLASNPNQLASWLEPLADAGVDVFHCSQRRFWEPEFSGSNLNFAGWAKKLTGRATISVGSVGLSSSVSASYQGISSAPASLVEVVRRLEREEFDMIAVGRALLQDPDWADTVRGGNETDRKAFFPTSFSEIT